MRYWTEVGLSGFFGCLSALCLLGLAGVAAALVVSLINIVINTGIDVSMLRAIKATFVFVVVFAVSAKLFIYFSQEKYK